MSRIIGIRHRIKKTAEGEARPTQVCILKDGKTINLELATETDELDFVLGRFPTSFRKVEKSEDISSFSSHHVMWKKFRTEISYKDLAEFTESVDLHESQIRKEKEDRLDRTPSPTIRFQQTERRGRCDQG